MKPLFLVVLVSFCAPAYASGPELFGMGPRPAALAGAGVADGDGWDQAYTNPAGLVDAKRRRLTLGYLGARYSLTLDGSGRSSRPRTESCSARCCRSRSVAC